MKQLLTALAVGALVPMSVTIQSVSAAEIDAAFESQSLTVAEEFSIVFETAEVTDPEIVEIESVDVENQTVTFQTAAPGTTQILLKGEGEAFDTIEVTVGEDGTAAVDNLIRWNGWNTIGGEQMYYQNGEAVTGWYSPEDNDIWYHFDGQGAMETGWFQDETDGGTWFYLSEASETLGQMARGWIIDSTGWKTYYLDSNGRMLHSCWINAAEDNELGRPAGYYYLTDDGAVQMNGWAESVTPGIYWRLRAGDGYFEKENPDCWSTDSSLVSDDYIAKFPQNRAGTEYFYSTGSGANIVIHEISGNTVIFSLYNIEESLYAGIERGEAEIIDQDTVRYRDESHDLTMHWEPLTWGLEKFEEGELSTGAIHVSGKWPEECDLSSDLEYISRKDADIMEVS